MVTTQAQRDVGAGPRLPGADSRAAPVGGPAGAKVETLLTSGGSLGPVGGQAPMGFRQPDHQAGVPAVEGSPVHPSAGARLPQQSASAEAVRTSYASHLLAGPGECSENPPVATPPRPSDITPVRCPDCRGRSVDVPALCSACGGAGEVLVFWASVGPQTSETKRHLVLVSSAPAACLCGLTFPVKQLQQPCGLPCEKCIGQFDTVSIVTLRQRELADELVHDDGLLEETTMANPSSATAVTILDDVLAGVQVCRPLMRSETPSDR